MPVGNRVDRASILVNSLDMVLMFSRAMDLVHPAVSEHHLRVAYAAACIAGEMGLSDADVQSVLVAGALHDVAAACAPQTKRLLDRALQGEFDSVGNEIHEHGFACHSMLSGFAPFAKAAQVIRYHHVNWNDGEGAYFAGSRVPLESHILHLADRLSVLPPDGRPPQVHAEEMASDLRGRGGREFHPAAIAAFEQAACREAFWLDLTSRHKEALLKERFGGKALHLDGDSLYDLARVLARIVDYRSSYTALHSAGVARTSGILARKAGLPDSTVRLVGVAGYLHDVGKLSINPSLLEKPGKLTREEMLLIRQHPYHTREILSAVPGLEAVSLWAALHHERLDGKGYPFRETRIPLEARIVAVADIFTAITEDRPYRRGMEKAECLRVLHGQVKEGAIDGELVSLLEEAYDEASQ